MKLRWAHIIGVLLAASATAAGQDWDRPVPLKMPVPAGRLSMAEIIARGDSLHRTLNFQEAIDHYLSVSGALPNGMSQEELERRISASQNGLNMMEFCADPHVVARQRFSRKDFFLFYPLKPQGWHSSPNPLDSLGGFPTYAPKDADVIYYSATDRSGSRSLFVTEDLDSLWRAPRLAGESVLSTGSEVFPMLSPDGRTLYFASDGLYGMGGFDLYSSTWDDETATWGDPVNLGFPFSSPADDFLLMDTEDGAYTLFASNRDCGADSVYVYVLESGSWRSRKPVRETLELQRIASLRPVEDPTRIDNDAMTPETVENANTRLYKRKMDEARALRDSIYRYEKDLDALRLRLSETPDQTADITAHIRDKEAALEPLRKLLEETQLEIRLVEQSFLQSGVATSVAAADREVVGAKGGYTFAKHTLGGKMKMKLGRVVSVPSFRIMPMGRFAQDNTLPAGIVYQLELFTSPRHATVDELKGLSPVYERLGSSLRYTYSVGLYSSYSDALLDLNTVRMLGFPSARIVAFRDGRSIPVRTARQEE